MTTPIDDTPVTDRAVREGYSDDDECYGVPSDKMRDLERVANRLEGLINELAEKRTDQLGFYYVSKHMGGIGNELSHKISAALRDFEELRKQISPDPNTNNT